MKTKHFRVVNRFIRVLPSRLIVKIYRKLGAEIGEKTQIYPDIHLDNPKHLTVGRNSLVNRYCKFYTGDCSDPAHIKIGDNVKIAFGVSFVGITHEPGDSKERAGDITHKDITIGDGCWIGANVTILPGVKVGKGVVIGAGALVNKDLEDNCLYCGVPARKIKELD